MVLAALLLPHLARAAAEDKPITLAPDKPVEAAPAADTTKVAKTKKVKGAKAPKAPEKSLEEQRAEDGLWTKHTNWLSLRAGYAKATGDFAGDGVAGYGIAFQHMLTNRMAIGGAVHHEWLGHLGPASEIAVPFTLELTRHFRWSNTMRPYAGFGAGYYFHKYYRTAGDYTGSPGTGYHVVFGGNVPVDDHHLIGLDARMSFLSTTKDAVNPVFGTSKGTEVLWSIKLNYAFAY
jgi:hypothetical protein